MSHNIIANLGACVTTIQFLMYSY